MKFPIVLWSTLFHSTLMLQVAVAETQLEPSDWTQVTASAPWSARHWFAAVSHRGKMWVLGGAEDSDPGIWSSSQGREWMRESKPTPWKPFYGHSAVVFKDSIWVFSESIWSSADGSAWNEESQVAPWSGQVFTSAAVYREKMWVLGGFLFGEGTQRNVWCSDDGKKWNQTTSSAPWSNRSQISSAVWNNKLWVVAGGRQAKTQGLWYSENGVDWTAAIESPPWKVTGGHTVLSFEEKLWVIGGGMQGNVSGVWNSEDGSDWKHVTPAPSWSPRRCHASVIHDDKIWLLGGQGTTIPGHEGDFIRSAINEQGDCAYFFPRGTVSRPPRALKVKLTDGDELPELSEMVLQDSAEVKSATAQTARLATTSQWRGVADADNRYRYIYHFKPPPGRLVMTGKDRSVDVPLPPRNGRLRASGCVVADPVRGYVYVGTARGPKIPAEIVKFAMGDNETDARVIDAEVLHDGECNLSCACVDNASGYAYFGANTNRTSSVVKIALGKRDKPPQRVGAVALPEEYHDLRTCVFDGSKYAYFATREAIIKIALGEGATPPKLVGLVNVDMPTNLKSDVWCFGESL